MGGPVYVVIEESGLLGELFEKFGQIKLDKDFITLAYYYTVDFTLCPSTIS